MSRAHRASPGLVARGKIRVDARKAVEKLREHLLIDLHLYTLELVRAAVAGGASSIDVEYDADDVSLTFDGESLDEGTLTRLLDHVLVDAVSEEARRKRLLAMSVNAALGLSPLYIEILSPAAPVSETEAQGAAGECLRVRWTPELLHRKDKDEAAAAPDCDRVPAPVGMPRSGIRVEVRRRIGWTVVRQAIAGKLPPEIALLAAATHDLRAPMTLGGGPFPRPVRPPALVRAPFEVRGAKRAVLEIVPALKVHPQVEYLEHGVRLTRYAWSFGADFPSDPLGEIALPVRVIVDADELPTNASRSELRHDSPFSGFVAKGALHAWSDAIQSLVSAVTGQGEGVPGTDVLSKDATLLEDALGAIVCVVARAMQDGVAVPERARALLDVPLLRDALGRPIAPAVLLADPPLVLHLWRGLEPLSKDFALWTRSMIWLRGRVAEGVVDLLKTADAEAFVKQAKVGVARRLALLAHAPAEPVVPPLGDALLRQSFHEREGECAGLRGEVAIVAESAERPDTVVRVFFEGRLLASIHVSVEKIPLRLEMALAWEGRFTPTMAFDGIVEDSTFHLAVWFAARVAVLAADREASRLAEKGAMRTRFRPVLRAAVATCLLSAKRLGVVRPSLDFTLSSLGALVRAPVWPTTEPERWESVQSLEAVVARTGALCVARHDMEGRAVDGRPVIAAKPREMEWLTAALAPCPTLVPYSGWVLSASQLLDREARRSQMLQDILALSSAAAWPVMDLARPDLSGLITVGPAGKLVLLHAGRRLQELPFTPSLGHVIAVVDDDTAVPSVSGEGTLCSSAKDIIESVERQLCETLVAALEGDLVSHALLGPGAPNDLCSMAVDIRVYLIDSAHSLRGRAAGGERPDDAALMDRIQALPFMIELDERGAPTPISLAGIEQTHPMPAKISLLEKPPGFETFVWRPVIIPRSEKALADALARWSQGRARAGDDEIPARMESAAFQVERRILLAKPALNPQEMGDLVEPQAHVAFLSGQNHGLPPGVTIAAALPSDDSSETAPDGQIAIMKRAVLDHALLDVLYHDRLICRCPLRSLQLPIVARVSVRDEAYLEQWSSLSELGVAMVTEHARTAAISLASEIVNRSFGPSVAGALQCNLRALRLIDSLLRSAPEEQPPWLQSRRLVALLRSEELLWPTVQGEWLPLSAMRVAAAKGVMRELYTGSTCYVPWLGAARGQSELDSPILHIPQTPEGAVFQSILGMISESQFRSVTDALAKLQSRRAVARPSEASALPGAPAYPALRFSLADAGIQSAEGQIEIVEGPASNVRILGLDGSVALMTDDIPLPLHVVARVDSVDVRPESAKALVKEISKAAVRYLLSFNRKLDEMPLFVRDHLRTILCKTIGNKAKPSSRQLKASIFADLEGNWRSLEELQKGADPHVLFTTDPPPYPKRKPKALAIRLSKADADGLARILALKDMTPVMRRDRISEERASAPPAPSIGLLDDVRSKCARIIKVNDPDMIGEIGILAPQHQALRGIDLFITMRSLCSLDDGPGWGLHAVVNKNSVKPNRWFDGVRSQGAMEEVMQRVRQIAMEAMREWLAPPADALAMRWIDAPSAVDSDKPVALAGALWLPATWPREPSIRMVCELGVEPMRQPVTAVSAARGLKRHIPICGDLIAAPGVTWAMVENLAIRETQIMIQEVLKSGQGGDALAAYQWNMGLLGFAAVMVPPARTADGGKVNPPAVVAELVKRGCVWFTRRAGSAEGMFPSDPPSFVLLDDGSPAIEVLRHRALAGMLRELGGEEIGSAAVHVAQVPLRPAVSSPLPPVVIEEEQPAPPAALSSPLDAATSLPWLERLRRRVALLLQQPRVTQAPPPNALCTALHQALGELGLVGGPVHAIVEAKRGRAVRYDGSSKTVTINRSHSALVWLRDSQAPSARALSVLLAAIVSEINRSLDTVTDAEERRVLEQLLRAGLQATGTK